MSHWDNKDNFDFYENVPVTQLIKYAKMRGMDRCADLKHLQKIINESRNIFEIGAGYGRVVEYLLKNSKSPITAIEKSTALCDHLNIQFHSKINLIKQDLCDLHLEEKFDLILWLCGGICNFSDTEQPKIIDILLSHLHCNGKLIIETCIQDLEPIYFMSHDKNDFRYIQMNDAKLYYHIPPESFFLELLKLPLIQTVEKIIYKPDKKNNARNLFIITRK